MDAIGLATFFVFFDGNTTSSVFGNVFGYSCTSILLVLQSCWHLLYECQDSQTLRSQPMSVVDLIVAAVDFSS